MKNTKLKFLSLVAALGFISIASPAMAEWVDISSVNAQGQVTINGNGFDHGVRKSNVYEVNVYIDGKEIGTKGWQTNPNGTFNFTTRSGTVGSGDRVTVKVLQYRGGSNHWEFTKTVYGGGGNPNPPPSGGVDPNKIYPYANQQARTVANRIAKVYGRREAWRRSFTQGFQAGVAVMSTMNRPGHPSYDTGYVEGLNAGSQAGTSAGLEAARNRAAQARADVHGLFAAAVDTGQRPDTTVRTPADLLNFSGVASSVQTKSVDDVLNEYDADFQKELRALQFEADGTYYGYDVWSFEDPWSLTLAYRASSSGYEFLQSYFRADYALREWKTERLGRYDQTLYNQMTYSQQQTFENNFTTIYDNVIDRKYLDELYRNRDASAYTRGFFYGERVATRSIYYSGYSAGYNTQFTQNSVVAYRNSVESEYGSVFNAEVQRYSTQAVLELGSGNVQLFADSGLTYEAGKTVGVRITSIRNLGLVDANVSVSADGVQLQALTAGTLAVPASSSLKSSVEFKGVARIAGQIETDKANSVTVRIGSLSVETSFNVSWESILNQLNNLSPGVADLGQLRTMIIDNLKKEIIAARDGKGNPYDAKDSRYSSTKLYRLVQFKKNGATTQGLKNISDMYSEIYAVRKTINGFLHPKIQGRYEDLAEQLK